MSVLIQPDILHLEACNFIDKPTGGQLTFSRQLMKTFGNRLALVGWATSPKEPIGSWFTKEIDGTMYHYFAIGRHRSSSNKPFFPVRFITWLQIKRYQRQIFSIGIPNILICEHSILMAINVPYGYNLCFRFPGVESPLSLSRYSWAKSLSSFFDRLFFQSLSKKVSCILAAADGMAIAELKERAGVVLRDCSIVSFPTRVDTDVFHPADCLAAREKLGLPVDATIAVATGRIHWAKGWEFLLESFQRFAKRFPKSLLIFLGDGAELEDLKQKVQTLGLTKQVIIAGYKTPSEVAVWLQSANLFVMGSLKEGWSTVLVEALACHLPIVTTKFSSADTIVQHGINGFVVDRDPEEFSLAMGKALNLPEINKYVAGVIDEYALRNLGYDLLRIWNLRKKLITTSLC